MNKNQWLFFVILDKWRRTVVIERTISPIMVNPICSTIPCFIENNKTLVSHVFSSQRFRDIKPLHDKYSQLRKHLKN